MSEKLIAAAIEAAVSRVAQSPDAALDRKDAPAVAEALKEQMPAPLALEALWPQLLRQGIVFAGGVVVGKGWLSAEDWQMVSGLLIAAAPVVYRVAATWFARLAAQG